MFDTAPLERLALALDHAAEVAKAKEAQHIQASEPQPAAVEHKRIVRNQAYAADVRAAIKELQRRDKRRKAAVADPSRPTWEEAAAYAKEIGFPEKELAGWFDHFTSNGWKVGKARTPMVDWKSAIRNGFRKYKRENAGQPPQRSAINREQDPPGWKPFLSTIGRTYEAFAFATPFLKDDFRKARKANANAA